MSSEIAIKVEGVSKVFTPLGGARDRLRKMLQAGSGEPVTSDPRAFRALDNISFEVPRGSTFGILGQNGSGKSTLLQIISGIMAPSSGTVAVKGKVAALLELGSGFNPEFTGRENVYLNASVLGLSREDVTNRFEAIAGFADIGEHLDQPVKTYSSGMTLRLAFAVQVAIDPEILIIDEALAVGDAKFQLKCFRRLEELKAAGTTILFVSHATELVKSFCDSALVLKHGQILFVGDSKLATIKYYEDMFPEQAGTTSSPATVETAPPARVEPQPASRPDVLLVHPEEVATSTFGVGGATLHSLEIGGVGRSAQFVGGSDIEAEAVLDWDVEFLRGLIEAERYEGNIALGLSVANGRGSYVFGGNGFDAALKLDCLTRSSARVRLRFTMPHLSEGDYFLTATIALGNLAHHVQLKWYDCFLPIRCSPGERNVFGLLAVDYSMTEVTDGADNA